MAWGEIATVAIETVPDLLGGGEKFTECAAEPPHDQVRLMLERIQPTDERKLAQLHDKANPNFPPKFYEGLTAGQLAFRAVGGRDCEVRKHHDFADFFQQMMRKYVDEYGSEGGSGTSWGGAATSPWSSTGTSSGTAPTSPSGTTGGTAVAAPRIPGAGLAAFGGLVFVLLLVLLAGR